MSFKIPQLPERKRLWVAAGYCAVVLIWGTTWFAVRTQVNGTSPHVASALRLGSAALIFFAIALATGLSLRIKRRDVGLLAIQGVCFFGVNHACVYTASQYLTSGVLAVIFSITLPFNIVADRIMNGTRARPLVVLAALIGVCGITFVFADELEHAMQTEHALFGAALAVLAAAVVAIGNVLAARLAATPLGAVRLNAFGLAAGAASVLLWGTATGAPWSLRATPEWLAGFAYLLTFGSVGAFWIYLKILPIVGVVAGAYVVVLSPVVALLISATFEGLPLGWGTLGGTVLLLAGHSMLVLGRSRTARAAV